MEVPYMRITYLKILLESCMFARCFAFLSFKTPFKELSMTICLSSIRRKFVFHVPMLGHYILNRMLSKN